jgi:hypothetical protein
MTVIVDRRVRMANKDGLDIQGRGRRIHPRLGHAEQLGMAEDPGLA